MKLNLQARIATLLLLLFAPPCLGQQYSLRPERWVPLEVGNYWHYTNEGGEGVFIVSEWIIKTVQDTLVGGKRWTRLEAVHCVYGPECPSGVSIWLSFSEDHYLLRRSPFNSRPDTVLATHPRSVFVANVPIDTLFAGGSPVYVSIVKNEDGQEGDSTHLRLNVERDVFFGGTFVYNIGNAGGLIGAVVNGIEYGNTEQIRSLVLPVERIPPVTGDLMVLAYPNPFVTAVTITLESHQTGEHHLAVYDELGREVWTTTQWLTAGQERQLTWGVYQQSQGAGVYFVQIIDARGRAHVTPVVQVR